MDISSFKNYDYLEHLKTRKEILEKYPFVLSKTVGKSVMGREIFSFSIGDAEEYVLFLGGLHGTDRFSFGMLMTFFEEVCLAVSQDLVMEGMRVRKALSGRAVAIIPCVNPDGCEIASKGKSGCGNRADLVRELSKKSNEDIRFNARGADIDINFNSKRPLSEPESRAVADFCKEESVRHALILGSGEGEIITAGGEKFSDRGAKMTEIMVTSTGYSVSENKEGFLKWFSEEYRKPAFKVLPKVSDGSDFLKVYGEIRELLLLSAIM